MNSIHGHVAVNTDNTVQHRASDMSLTTMISRSVAASNVAPYGFDVPAHITRALRGISATNVERSTRAKLSVLRTGMYVPQRNEAFREYLREILLLYGRATKREVDKMINTRTVALFAEGLTNKEVDPVHNYEMYEKSGDRHVNALIVELIMERYPALQCANMQFAVSEIEGRMKNTTTLSAWGDAMGLLPWVSSSYQERVMNRQSLLEDAFESFIQCVRYAARDCVGWAAFVNMPRNIVSHFVYKEDKISLRLIDFRPAKTLVKETYENGHLGKLVERKTPQRFATTVSAGVIPNGGSWLQIGCATDRDPKKAADKAWRQGIHFLVQRKMISEQNIAKIMIDLEKKKGTTVLYFQYQEDGGLRNC